MYILRVIYTYLVSLSGKPTNWHRTPLTDSWGCLTVSVVMRVQCSSANSRGHCKTYAPLSTCTELHLSGKFLSLILGQSEVRSKRLPAKFRCSKRVT